MKKKFLGLILSLLIMNLYGQDRIVSRNFATRSVIYARNGMACTSHPLATQIALDILKEGGTAVDAAIAANAALGLMEPTGAGIGGDLFALVWDASSKKLYGLNASGRSPMGLTLDYFKANGYQKIPPYGPLPVTIPGCVDGWFELHDKFGKLSMKKILAPAIKYARDGFPMTELIAYYLQISAKRFKDYPHFAEIWMPNGKAPAEGEIFRNPYLAHTYEILAQKGRDAFYRGELTPIMVKFLQSQGGFHTMEDFNNYHSEWVEPVSTNYRGYDVWELPPNGQGIAVLEMLNILEQFDIASMGFGSKEYMHLFIEAKKLAYEDRAKYYADPAFAQIPLQKLISKEYARQRAQLIDMDRAGYEYPAGELETGNTVYLTVADKDGNMISLIQSNYRGMGSGMVPPGLGFMFQDRGELFSLEENHANVYAPGKRPFHTIIPGFVTKNGKPWLSFGVMGGAMQPQGHVQILVNLIDFKMNLQEAGDAPRIRHSSSSQPTGGKMKDGGWVNLESGFDYDVIKELMKMGHKIKFSLGGYGGYQAILFDEKNHVYQGASESRKDGQASGY